MIIDRRKMLAVLGGAGFSTVTNAKDLSPIDEHAVDGGRWNKIPEFEGYLKPNADFSSIKVVAGLRPHRVVGETGTLRLQSERTSDGKIIVHNYGHSGGGVTFGLGSASVIENWLSEQPDVMRDARVTIVGAGVVGLSAAYVLKRRGYSNISIRAREVSSGNFEAAKTVSDIAGGQFDAAGVDDVSGDIVAQTSSSDRKIKLLKESLALLTEHRGAARDPFKDLYTLVRNYITNPYKPPQGLKDANAAINANKVLRALIDKRNSENDRIILMHPLIFEMT